MWYIILIVLSVLSVLLLTWALCRVAADWGKWDEVIEERIRNAEPGTYQYTGPVPNNLPEPPCRDCNRIMAYQFLNGANWRVLAAMYGLRKWKFYETIKDSCAEINPLADALTIAEIKRNRHLFFDFEEGNENERMQAAKK